MFGLGETAKLFVVVIEGLSKSFGSRQVLHDIDLTLAPSEFITVVGQSGSGKSTLLRIL